MPVDPAAVFSGFGSGGNRRPQADEAPMTKNAGLLFFNDAPDRFFPGRQIDVLWFPEGAGGDRFTEKIFQGPLARMTREALVNAVYHRSYEEREPIEVRISHDELVVLSFPGPDRSIRLADLPAGRAVSRRYRNRRATGIPKILKGMAANGSPAPVFESDDARVSFVIRLPVHPQALKLTDQDTGEVTGEVAGEVTGEVRRLLNLLDGEMTRQSLQQGLELKHEDHFRNAYLVPALQAGLIEMTLPDKPRSRNQRYRLTALGRRAKAV